MVPLSFDNTTRAARVESLNLIPPPDNAQANASAEESFDSHFRNDEKPATSTPPANDDRRPRETADRPGEETTRTVTEEPSDQGPSERKRPRPRKTKPMIMRPRRMMGNHPPIPPGKKENPQVAVVAAGAVLELETADATPAAEEAELLDEVNTEAESGASADGGTKRGTAPTRPNTLSADEISLAEGGKAEDEATAGQSAQATRSQQATAALGDRQDGDAAANDREGRGAHVAVQELPTGALERTSEKPEETTSEPRQRAVATPTAIPTEASADASTMGFDQHAQAEQQAPRSSPTRASDEADSQSVTPSQRFAQHLSWRSGDDAVDGPQLLSSRSADGAVDGPQLRGADQVRFVERVARAFRVAEGRDGIVRLRLHPPELGSLRLELKVEGGALAARLDVESPMARSLLVDSLPVLRERLAEQGIRVEQFDVELLDRQSGGQFDGLEQREQHEHDDQSSSSNGGSVETDENQRPDGMPGLMHSGDNEQLDVVI